MTDQGSSETTRYGGEPFPAGESPVDPEATRLSTGGAGSDGAGPVDGTCLPADATRPLADGTHLPADGTRLPADGTRWPGAVVDGDATHMGELASGTFADGTHADRRLAGGATFSGTLEERGPDGVAPLDADATYLTYEGGAVAGSAAAGRAPQQVQWRRGEVVDGYALEETLGEGGMGIVFAARDSRTGARYALKTLSLASTPLLRERFVREGHAVARVGGHPNVVSVHRAGEVAGKLYLVMDLVEGGDLKARIARNGPMGWRDACGLVASLCRGMSSAHQRGILHRDLKPANVMFDEQGTPKLVDFGIARMVDEHSLTATSAFMGSPPYMPPELAEQRPKDVDQRSDVYGLGAILFHALTGAAPYTGPTALAIAQQVISAPPPRPSALRDGVPLALDRVVLRAMAKAPEARFPTAAALREALEGLLEEDEAAASRGRPRRVAVAVGLAALAASGVFLAQGSLPSGERGPRDSRPDRSARSGGAASAAKGRPLASLLADAGGKPGPARLAAYRALRAHRAGLAGREQRDVERALRHLQGEVLLEVGPIEFRALADPAPVDAARLVVRYRSHEWPSPRSRLALVDARGGRTFLPLEGVWARAVGVWADDPGGPSLFVLDRARGLSWIELASGARLGPGRAASEGLAWSAPSDAVATPLGRDEPEGFWSQVSIAPDGGAIAVAGSFQRAVILELPSLRILGRTEPRVRATYSLSWSPDGQRLLTSAGRPPYGKTRLDGAYAGAENTVTIWSRTGAKLWERGPGVRAAASAFFGEDRIVLGADDHTVKLLSLVGAPSPVEYGSGLSFGGMARTDHSRALSKVLALDGRRFLSLAMDYKASEAAPNELAVWDVERTDSPLLWKAFSEEVTAVAVGHGADTLLVGFVDGTLQVVAAPPLD